VARGGCYPLAISCSRWRVYKEFQIDLSSLSATEAMETVSGDEKQTLSYLQELSERARRRIARLVVVEGRRDYYSAYVLNRYLQELPRLKYIEVRKSTGEFRALIPVKVLLTRRYRHRHYDVAEEQLMPFLRALEDGSVLADYREEALVRHVDTTIPVIEALRLMRANRDSEIPVVDENFYFMGVLVEREVERQIVEIVLAQQN
jgi:CBS domain-containing protein